LTGDSRCPIIARTLLDMVKIRLSRTGAKNRPFYRIVVADSRAPRNGSVIGVVGHYGPLTDPATIKIDREAVLAWLKKGAQPTESVARLLAKAGIGQESGEGK
jgi:small subunit ribosomal protein S16